MSNNDEKYQEFLNEIHSVFSERERVAVETQDNCNWEIQKCHEREVDLFTDNLSFTFRFLQNECTPAEFSWMSEVFDEIIEKTRSHELISLWYQTAKRFPEETQEYNILYFIECADAYLESLETEEKN